MKKAIVLIPFMMILSACQPPMTREQELMIYRSRCFDYGFKMGTIEFAQCVQDQEARQDMLFMKERQVHAIEQQNSIERTKARIKQDEYDLKREKYKKEKKNKKRHT